MVGLALVAGGPKALFAQSRRLFSACKRQWARRKAKKAEKKERKQSAVVRMASSREAMEWEQIEAEQQPRLATLDAPLLESVLEKLDISNRLRLTGMSQSARSAASRIPLRLPLLLIRSAGIGRLDLHSEHLDVLLSHVLADAPFKIHRGRDSIRIEEGNAYEFGRALGSNISGVTQLWLDSAVNAEIARGIVDVHVQREAAENVGQRFGIEQLTVIGSRRPTDFDPLSLLLRLSRRTLQSVRMRRVRLHSEDAVSFLWSSLALCQKLFQLQYEPTRLDHWSRPHIVDALHGKPITSLILTGVAGLCAADLMSVASGKWMAELSVVGELIRPSALAVPALRPTIQALSNLLIQMDEWFSLHDPTERASLLSLLLSLQETATLEVVHVCKGGSAEAARVCSYWLELAKSDKTNILLFR